MCATIVRFYVPLWETDGEADSSIQSRAWWVEAGKQKLLAPGGQISSLPVHPLSQKYPASVLSQITGISAPVLFPLEGAYRDRHERWEWDAVDAVARKTKRA